MSTEIQKVKVQIVNKSNNPMPAYATPDSAGMDIRAYLPDGAVVLQPGERKLIHTGIYISLPRGYECQIRARSGLALKSGICLANGIGTVDADYKNEVGVILINLGQDDFIVNSGDRVAQMVIKQYSFVEWEPVAELDGPDRGGGFGHTGVQ